MAAVLIAAISIGFASCSKDEEKPEPEVTSDVLIRRWPSYQSQQGTIEFKKDGTYIYTSESETITGMYRVNETSKVSITYSNRGITYNVDGVLYPEGVELEFTYTYDYTLFKLLASSGSSVFDQIWVYYSSKFSQRISVELYSGNEMVRRLGYYDELYNW